MTTIAFLGLGAMGSRMAANLVRAGHTVTVWNRSPERAAPLVALGARQADNPRAAVTGADVAIAMVRDDEASRRVWLAPDDGALAGLPSGSLALDSSTLSVAWVAELARAAAAAGVELLDAPVAGSRPQADAMQLLYLVGGSDRAVARAEPVLKAMGAAVHHVGPSGSGAMVKLAVNTLFAVQVAALGEVFGLLQAGGLDTARALDVITATPVCSPAARGAAVSMQAGAFAPQFPVELVRKDIGYAIGAAAALGARLPLARAVGAVLAEADGQGYGADNLTGLVRIYAR